MWIFCVGSKRSGSTLQYNIVSRIVELKNLGIRLPHSSPDEFLKVFKEYNDSSQYKVFKTHAFTNDIEEAIKTSNSKIIYCYRDIRDVIVSVLNKEWISRSLISISDFTNKYIEDYDGWMQYENEMYISKYEDFYLNIRSEIKNIARYLNIDLESSEIEQIASELSIKNLKSKELNDGDIQKKGNFVFNKKTLLHEKHIQDTVAGQYLNKLSEKEIIEIEKVGYKWLNKNGYKLYWPLTNKFVSNSQHADDYIGWQLLDRPSSGVVVEVGAFDGVHLSNSLVFEQLGWGSICIEPNPTIFKHLEKNRPASKNINMAIVGDENISTIDFFAEEIGVLSGCNYDADDVKKRYGNRGLEYREPEKINVSATTLSSLFDKLKIDVIDVLSIDVEGFELEVLKGLDLKSFNVKLFIIEANDDEYKAKILNFFKNNPEYIYVGNNYQNLFFIKKRYLLKKNIRNLDLQNYTKAKQYHPKGSTYVIDSTAPSFIESKEALKFKRYLGIF